MSGLAALLAGREQPGVWLWEGALDPADVAAAVRSAGWEFGHVDGWTRGSTKPEILAALGDALGFGRHYGANLDALTDCLRETGAATGSRGGTILLWDGWTTLASSDARTFAVVLDILDERASKAEPSPFVVILRGDGPPLDGVALLD